MTSITIKDEANIETCPICLEEITESHDKKTFSCGHFVCMTCYEKFRTYQLSFMCQDVFCPQCRNVEESYNSYETQLTNMLLLGNILGRMDGGLYSNYALSRQIRLMQERERDIESQEPRFSFVQKKYCVIGFYFFMLSFIITFICIIVWLLVKCTILPNQFNCNRGSK